MYCTSVRFKSRRDTANTRYYRAKYNKNRLFELATATGVYLATFVPENNFFPLYIFRN